MRAGFLNEVESSKKQDSFEYGGMDMNLRRRSGLNFSRRRRKVNVSLAKEIFSWAGEIAVVVLIALVLMYFFGYHTSVAGQSMLGTLENGDEVLVNRFVYKLTQPKANDIVVFLPNGNKQSHLYVKRVIGVPGDRVQVKDGRVYVNGEKYTEVIDAAKIEHPELAEDEIEVGEDEFFVLGDNRNNSEDSRYANIGNVKKEHIAGKAWFVIAPFRNFGFLK